MQTLKWYLSNQAYFCYSGQHCVVLDLKHDKYLCVPSGSFQRLARWLRSPLDDAHGSVSHPTTLPQDLVSLSEDLFEREILVGEPASARPAEPTTLTCPARSLLSNTNASTGLCIPHIPIFALACYRAAHSLKRYPLMRTVREVLDRKMRRRQNDYDPGRALRLIRSFNTLRLSFPGAYVCLFDSLALLNFLAYFDFFPTWVFGISSEPFAAHCWIQEDETVLNDTLANVCGFAPIMTI
jgi:hypothetical protein